MNNKEFISAVARATGYSQDDTQKNIATIIEAISTMLDDGENVTMANFGTFEVKKRAERVIVNPSSGLRMLVPPKLVLGFKPAAQIRETLKKGGDE